MTSSDYHTRQTASIVEGWSRRTFLGALGAVAAGTVAACTNSGEDTPDAVRGNVGDGATRPSTKGAGDSYTPTPPFTLTAESELSEDYFLVQNHRIDPHKDKVVAYSRADGEVEAVVLQDGVVKRIYRDPTQAGGWNVDPLPDADGVIDMVAGVSAPRNADGKSELKVGYLKSADRTHLFVSALTLTESAINPTPSKGFTTTSFPWSPTAGSLQITLNADGSILVAAVAASTSKTHAQLWYYTDAYPGPVPTAGQSGSLNGFDYSSSPFNRWSAIVTRWAGWNQDQYDHPALTMYLPGTSASAAVQIWSYDLVTGKPSGTMHSIHPNAGAPKTPTSDTSVTAVNYLTVFGGPYRPTALVWTEHSGKGPLNPRLWMLTYDDLSGETWRWTELVLPASVANGSGLVPISTALAPAAYPDVHTATCLLDVFVVADGTLQVLRQAEGGDSGDIMRPVYCPVIPLQPDIARMDSEPAPSSGNELIVVDDNGNLVALEKDPASGTWTTTVVQVPAASMQQASAYRVELTLYDAWNQGLAGRELRIVASSPATAVVEGSADQAKTVSLGDDPVSVTTDAQGGAIVALLADGVSAPTLTITGDGLSEPLTVYPSAAVNTYLTGDTHTKLNYLDPLSAQTLQNATIPQTGDALVPPAARAYVSDAVGTMTAAAQDAQHGMKQGMLAATIGRSDGRTRRPRGTSRPALVAVSVQVGSIEQWGHDALHAIKTGAAKVDKIAHEAGSHTYEIALDVKDWADNAITVLVQGIEDAAHVISAEFNRLAADIVKAVKWLEAEVIGVLRDSKAVSDKFATWTSDLCGFTSGLILANETKAVDWLKSERDSVTNAITTLADRYPPDGAQQVTLKGMAGYSPGGLVGTRRRPTPGRSSTPLRSSDENPKTTTHGNWFFNKIKHELARSGLSLDLSNLPDLTAKLQNYGGGGTYADEYLTLLEEKLLVGFLENVVKHPTDVNAVVVQPLLHAVIELVDVAFDLAEDVVKVACDVLQDVLNTVIPHLLDDTKLKNLPILGGLMKLIGLGDVSIGRVANMVFAFPATVTYKIEKGANAHPFASSQLTGGRGNGGRSLADEAEVLQIFAASAMGVWAGFDTISAAITAADGNGGILFEGIDIVAPLIVTVLTTPSPQNGEPFFEAPVTKNPADVLNFLAWLLGLVPAPCVALAHLFDEAIEDRDWRQRYQRRNTAFSAVSGVLALVFGMVGNGLSKHPSGADYAGAVLNNMPTIVAPGCYDEIKDATDGLSVVITMALTLICGGLGAAIYGADG